MIRLLVYWIFISLMFYQCDRYWIDSGIQLISYFILGLMVLVYLSYDRVSFLDRLIYLLLLIIPLSNFYIWCLDFIFHFQFPLINAYANADF